MNWLECPTADVTSSDCRNHKLLGSPTGPLDSNWSNSCYRHISFCIDNEFTWKKSNSNSYAKSPTNFQTFAIATHSIWLLRLNERWLDDSMWNRTQSDSRLCHNGHNNVANMSAILRLVRTEIMQIPIVKLIIIIPHPLNVSCCTTNERTNDRSTYSPLLRNRKMGKLQIAQSDKL